MSVRKNMSLQSMTLRCSVLFRLACGLVIAMLMSPAPPAVSA